MKATVLLLCLALAGAANLRKAAAPGDNGDISVSTAAKISAQELDAKSRDAANEKSDDATRKSRKEGFSNIETLLAKLRKFVEDERLRVDKMHQADVDRAEKYRDDEIAAANEMREMEVERLRLLVEGKTSARAGAHEDLLAKTAVFNEKKAAHEKTQAALAMSLQNQAFVTPLIAAEFQAQTASCADNDVRQTDAAKAQLVSDNKYIKEALDFVAGLRKSLTSFQDKEASVADVSQEFSCAGVACPADVCPDGKTRRQVGTNCCSCEEVVAGRAAVEASGEDISTQQGKSDAGIAVKVDTEGDKRSEAKQLDVEAAAHAKASAGAHETYTTEKNAEYEKSRIESATSLLSIHEQTKLHGLMATLISADPRYLDGQRLKLRSSQVQAITKALDIVETRLREEKVAVAKAHQDQLVALAEEFKGCNERADEARGAAEDNAQAAVDIATKNEKSAAASRRLANEEMDAAQQAFDGAESALASALATQEEQTNAANARYEKARTTSIANYDEAKAGFDKKESDAYTYLDGEMDLITQIETALKTAGAVSTEKLMMLAQMSQRLTQHVKRRLQARYVDSLEGQSGLKDKINSMLNSIDESLALELKTSEEAHTTDTETVIAFYTSTEAAAKATLEKEIARLQKIVDDAKDSMDTAKAELDTAKAEEAVALEELQKATAVRMAMEEEQRVGVPAAKKLRAEEEASALATKGVNTGIVESKKTQGLKYLTQERNTVDDIERLLANLGKDYKFKVPTGSSFMQIEAVEGQRKMTMEQHEALATLVSLLGRDGVKYTGTERTFDGSDHSDAQAVIDDVLRQVREAITASEGEVERNYKQDTAQVQAEYDAAMLAAKTKYEAEIARLQKQVDDAKAVEADKQGIFDEKKRVRKEKQAVYDQKVIEYKAALEKQRIEGQFARDTFAADELSARTYKSKRLANIKSEYESDLKYINDEKDAIRDIREALKDINFAMLLEAAAKYDEKQTTYMATNSFDLKTKMLTLLAGIDNNVNAELDRADREFKDDMNNNALEKLRADDEAEEFHRKDTKDLQDAVDAARKEFKDSDAALEKATAEHALASDRHQEDRDDLATAQSIETKNEPVFEAQYQRSKASADQVFAEEMEILDNKKARGDFYLKTNTDGLASIQNMLTHLDVTTTDTVDSPDTGAFSARAAYQTALQDDRFTARTLAESKRVKEASEAAAIKSYTVASTGGDNIIMSTEKGSERVLTKASNESAGYGYRKEFDDRGNFVGVLSDNARPCTYQDTTKAIGFIHAKKFEGCAGLGDALKSGGKPTEKDMCSCLVHFSDEEATEYGSCQCEHQKATVSDMHKFCVGEWTASKKAAGVAAAENALAAAKTAFIQTAEPGKVGTFIGALERSTDAEKAKSGKEYDDEVEAVDATRKKLTKKAREERDRLLKIDDERTAAAQAAYDKTLVALEKAEQKKDMATLRHETAASVLNDAILTQEKMQPIVDQQKADSLKFNKQTKATADKSVTDKKREADNYLNDELAMVQKIRELVNTKLGLAYPVLIEMVAHVVASHAAKMGSRTHARRYDFNIRESNRFEDKQDKAGDDYMETGTVARNDYGGKVTSIDGMLDENSGRINDEIKAVAQRHADDMAFLTKERFDALTAAKKKRDETVAALQAIVDAAAAAFKAASKARADQEDVRNNARSVLEAKQGALDGTMSLQSANMTLESSIKDDTDAATLAHFNKWMQHYTDEEKRAHEIIKREGGILADIRSILAKDSLGKAAEAQAQVNTCRKEKNAYDGAVDAATAAATKCNAEMIEAAHDNAELSAKVVADEQAVHERECSAYVCPTDLCADGKPRRPSGKQISGASDCCSCPEEVGGIGAAADFHEVRGDVAEGTGFLQVRAKQQTGPDCAAAGVAAAAMAAAKGAFEQCVATPASKLVKAALIEVNNLAKKYIKAKKYNEATAADIQAALEVISQLESTLASEDQAVTAGAKKDREDETALRDDKYAAALQRWSGSKAFHAAAVKAATGVRDAAKAEWNKQYNEWKRLLGVQNKKEEALRAAKAKYTREKLIAEDLKIQEDLAAENRYSQEKGKVDDIKRKDTAYLKAELGAIAELKKMVAELNEKGL